MKLYLSSYRIGNAPENLLSPAAGNQRVAVVQNSLDCYTDIEKRQSALAREFAELSALNLQPEVLDLREYFGKQSQLRQCLDAFSYLWVVGGNTFILRRAFSQSGLDSILHEFSKRDDFVYAGYSAGICVLCPTLRGIHLADDPDATAEGYAEQVYWDGLGIIPFAVAPHYKSEHHETELIDKCVEYYIENKIPFVALHDGEALVLDTNKPVELPPRVCG